MEFLNYRSEIYVFMTWKNARFFVQMKIISFDRNERTMVVIRYTLENEIMREVDCVPVYAITSITVPSDKFA